MLGLLGAIIIVVLLASHGNCMIADKEPVNYKLAVKDMFTFAYDNYMSLAYPEDELGKQFIVKDVTKIY